MALTLADQVTIQQLQQELVVTQVKDRQLVNYYEGLQRLRHLGIAVPPELRQFETVVNWCRTTVDTIQKRIKVKDFIRAGEETPDQEARLLWEMNNLQSTSSLMHRDLLIHGRAFVSVGTNPDDDTAPLITVESPMELAVKVNPRTRRIEQAFRLWGVDAQGKATLATLYTENSTIWLQMSATGFWMETDRDDHELGRVPIVMFLNRMRTGIYTGVSEMMDVIPLVDNVARTVTNLTVAAETHAIPQKNVVGMSKGDFLDKDGKALPIWQTYFDSVWATENKDAKFGQFAASDLKNFHSTVEFYGKMASSVSNLPARYFGITTTNPASYDAIRAEEIQLNNNVEAINETLSDGWSWVMELALRFKNGKWSEGRRIRAEFFDPSTPTLSQKADALQKLHGGGPIISREGAWDELGWSEARKDQERARFIAEASDPALEKLAASL